MNAFLTVVLLAGVLQVSPLPKNKILFSRFEKKGHDYQFEYEAEDGSRRQEIGTFIYKENSTEPVLHVKGLYEYFAEGRKFIVRYEASDQGVKREENVQKREKSGTTESS